MVLRFVGVVFFVNCIAMAFPQEGISLCGNNEFPIVSKASVPFYPNLARIGNVSGRVRLYITTNGYRAIKVEVKDGPAQLSKMAIENVNSWIFFDHKPTGFIAVFDYILDTLPPGANNLYKRDRISLCLPEKVEIHGTRQGEWDPISTSLDFHEGNSR